MVTYEGLLADIAVLPRPKNAAERKIHWVSNAKVLGVSRTPEDRIEIFLVGPQLATARPGLRNALEYGSWFREGSESTAFDANRLILPAVGYFDQIAAFICIELVRKDADGNLASAFRQSEQILDLVIERLRLSDGALLGLFGELLVIDALLRRASDEELPQVVDNWAGWTQSLRDLSWGTMGVEVKTTTRSNSTHEIHGVHQVELNDGLSVGPVETGLILVSIGVNYTVAHENALSVPDLVDRICARLKEIGREDMLDVFLSRVREYGAGTGFGYDHATMSKDATFVRPIEVVFARGYDMTDPNVSVLRRSDVVTHQHVELASLRYTVDLPVKVSGDLNPTVGLQQIAKVILGA